MNKKNKKKTQGKETRKKTTKISRLLQKHSSGK